MNRLNSILSSSLVQVKVDATSKKRAFEEAGLVFENLHGLSRALIADSLFARERLGSTGLGHGVAIPHGRIKGLKAPLAAVFQLANPIGFERAKGYTHKSEQVFCYLGKIKRATIIKQYPPDTVACIIWLKNRRPEVWRENPPAALDPLYQDAELEFIGVPSGKDPKFEKEMQQRFNNN